MCGVALGSGLRALEPSPSEEFPPWPWPVAVTLEMGILDKDGVGCQGWSCRELLRGKDGSWKGVLGEKNGAGGEVWRARMEVRGGLEGQGWEF